MTNTTELQSSQSYGLPKFSIFSLCYLVVMCVKKLPFSLLLLLIFFFFFSWFCKMLTWISLSYIYDVINIAGFHLVGRRCWNGSIFCMAQLSSKSNINTSWNLLKEVDVEVPITRGTQPHNIQQDQGLRLQCFFLLIFSFFLFLSNFVFCSHCNVIIIFFFSFNVIIVFFVGWKVM